MGLMRVSLAPNSIQIFDWRKEPEDEVMLHFILTTADGAIVGKKDVRLTFLRKTS